MRMTKVTTLHRDDWEVEDTVAIHEAVCSSAQSGILGLIFVIPTDLSAFYPRKKASNYGGIMNT